MILRLVDRFKVLSGYHFAVIIITILVPMGLSAGINFLRLDCWWVEALIYLGVFLVWALLVVLVFSWLVERDLEKASETVFEQTDALAEQLSGLNDGQRKLRCDLDQHVADLEDRISRALKPLGGELPPRGVYLSGTIMGAAVSMSGSLTVSGGSRLGRARAKFRCIWRRVWEILWGKR